MPRTYTSLFTHVVFATYERLPFITPSIRQPLHEYLGGIASNTGVEPLAIGGGEDHVHLLGFVPPTIALSDIVRKLKSNSSKWLHETGKAPRFGWQRGFAAFSVSPSAAPSVVRYIQNQEQRHRRRGFRQELVDRLTTAGIVFDEQYLFT